MASPKGGQGINALLRYLNYIISKIEKISTLKLIRNEIILYKRIKAV